MRLIHMEEAVVDFLKGKLREVDHFNLEHSVDQKARDRKLKKGLRDRIS